MQQTSIALQERRLSIQSNRKSFSPFYRLLDMTVITMVYFSFLAVSHVSVDFTSMVLLLVCILSYNLFAEVMKLYRFGRAPSNLVMFKTVSMVWCLASLLTATFAFALPILVPYSANLTLLFNLAATLPVLLMLRAVFTHIICILRVNGYDTRTAIIIGTAPSGYKLANQFAEEKHLGIHFMGFYDDRKSARLPNNMQYLVHGDVAKALEMANSGQVDYVYIALPIIAADRIVKILYDFSDSSAKLNLISEPLVGPIINARSQQIGSVQTISLFQD